MGRYADYRPANSNSRQAVNHWSQDVLPGHLWGSVSLRITADPEEWATANGIPLEQARESFRVFIDDIKGEAAARIAAAGGGWSAETQAPEETR
jgi:hypothetical protein